MKNIFGTQLNQSNLADQLSKFSCKLSSTTYCPQLFILTDFNFMLMFSTETLVADIVCYLWLSPQYSSLEKDLPIFSFSSIWFIRRQFCINTLSLNLSIRFLYILFVESWSLLKVIFLKARFWSTCILLIFSAFV